MKTLIKYSLLLVLAFGMLACQDEESTPGTGEIQFTLGSDLLDHSSGRTGASLPDGASLLISIEDASGNAVFTLKKVDLISFNGKYTSAPLKLENKNYNLTDFMIVDESNEVIYATPRAGSPFAKLVSKPLPIPFTITAGKSTAVPTQVVRADESTPEDFGYATFPINIAAFPEFAVSVFALKNGVLNLTSVQAYLLHEGDTIYRQYLSPKVSDIIFKGEPEGTYTFVLVKPGYGKYSRTFVLEELRAALDHSPLEIILPPAITITAIPSSVQPYSFYMSGIAGKKVVIDWGDGDTDSVTLSTFVPELYGSYEFTHDYTNSNRHFVSVTGDIEYIQEWGNGSVGEVIAVSVEHATGLQRFGLWFNYHVQHLDFTANQQLKILSVGFNNVTSINIAANKKLTQISIEELLSLPVPEIDKIVHDVYNNAVEMGHFNGYFLLQRYDYELDQAVLLGPPSPASLQKLQALEEEYSWWVEPNF